MKNIKIKFIGFWNNFNIYDNCIYNSLKKYYNVIISNNPDYIFFSIFSFPYEVCNYDCIRILVSQENYSPDFSITDYAISFDRMSYEDRFLRLPVFIMNNELYDSNIKHENINQDFINNKEFFCNYIYGNRKAHKERVEIFELLNSYKKVYSTGTFLNNTNPKFYTTNYDNKIAFQKRCKFSITFESTCQSGFITEKIMHGFAAKTIPIYYGDENIGEIFNTKAFINCHEYSNFNEVLEKVKEVDCDDSLYMKILSEPVFNDMSYISNKLYQLDQFLINIIDQEYDKAFRRPRVFQPYFHDLRLKKVNKLSKIKRWINLRHFWHLASVKLKKKYYSKRNIINRIK